MIYKNAMSGFVRRMVRNRFKYFWYVDRLHIGRSTDFIQIRRIKHLADERRAVLKTMLQAGQ